MSRTDTERLNFLQNLNNEKRYTGRCILRLSKYGRGWRLHETNQEEASISVREAIDDMMDAQEK